MLYSKSIVQYSLLYFSQLVLIWLLSTPQNYCRVTLVVAFGFLVKKYGKRWRHMNGTLSFYECRLSDGDTKRRGHSNPTWCNQINLNFLHSEVVGCKNIFLAPAGAPGFTLWNFYSIWLISVIKVFFSKLYYLLLLCLQKRSRTYDLMYRLTIWNRPVWS